MNAAADQSNSGDFERALRRGQFVITAEIVPPLSFARGDLLARAEPLKGLADAVNVTDGAGARAHMDPVTAAAILKTDGIEPILQLTCRDRNRIALQGALLAAATSGVRNLLLMRGDNPEAGDQPDAKGVFDLDTRGLIETASLMSRRGELPSGRKISGDAKFFIGCADTPVDPQADWSPKSLQAKIAAGSNFAQTQICMDAGVIRRYAARLMDAGVTRDFFLLIGVALMRSAGAAQWIRNHLPGAMVPDAALKRLQQASDQAAEGRRIALELIQDISAIPGVAGVHVMAPGDDGALGGFLKDVRALDLRSSARPGAAIPLR